MSTFLLKVIACIAMLTDHIAYFFPDMPVVFHWIGRISAPIFIFCLANGMRYTKSKIKYLLRLYIASVVMAFIQYFTHVELNIFRTLFSICLIICILELRTLNPNLYKRYIRIYIIYQIVSCGLCVYMSAICSANAEDFCFYLLPAILGNIFTLDGGLVFVVLGILLYMNFESKAHLTVVYSMFVAIYTLLMASPIVSVILLTIERIVPIAGDLISEVLEYILAVIIGLDPTMMGGSILFVQYEWMMIFALPIMLKYNNQRGYRAKWFFYMFYPAHIIILWFISGNWGA